MQPAKPGEKNHRTSHYPHKYTARARWLPGKLKELGVHGPPSYPGNCRTTTGDPHDRATRVKEAPRNIQLAAPPKGVMAEVRIGVGLFYASIVRCFFRNYI